MSKQHGKPKIPSNKLIQKKQSKDNNSYQGQAELSNWQNCSVEELRQRAKQVRKRVNEKQFQVMNSQKTYRMEVFKNQNMKTKVAEAGQYCQVVRMKIAAKSINKYKNNKDSPLFYNENGLSPFQLMLLRYDRYETNDQLICMICYMDIQPNSQIALLPCQHVFHRDCAVNHLLYNKSCSACGKEPNFEMAKEEESMKKE